DDFKYKSGDVKKALPHLKQLKSLREIQLTPHTTDGDLALLAELKDLEKLEEIVATFSEVTDAGLAKLKPLRHVKFLNVIGAKKVTAAGARALFKDMPTLETVYIKADDGIKR